MSVIEERDCLILDASWHPSGRFLATVGSDCWLHVFEAGSSFRLIFNYKRARSIRRCEWSPSGKHLAIASFDSSVVVFQLLEDEKKMIKFGELKDEDFCHESEVKTVRWSPDGGMLLTVGRDKTACVWSFPDMKFLFLHNEHKGDVKDGRFSPDKENPMFATVSFDGTTKLWEPGDELGSLQTLRDHEGTVWSLDFNPSNLDLATIGEDGKVILYKKNEDEEYVKANELNLQNNLEPLYSITFSNDQWIIAGSERKIFFVEPDLTRIIKVIKTNNIGDINCAKVNPINPNQIIVGSDDGTVVLINL